MTVGEAAARLGDGRRTAAQAKLEAMAAPVVFWFRRDLRLADSPALAAAAQRGPVIGVFVVDDALWRPAGPNRRAFLARSLRALDDDLDGRLVVRAGRPAAVIRQVAAEVGASEVFCTGDFGPYGHRRDEQVTAALVDAGAELHAVDSPYAVAPGTIRTKAGTPYKVFTPFRRRWVEHGWSPAGSAVDVDWVAGPDGDAVPDVEPSAAALPPAGEAAAHDAADAFLDGAVDDYHDRRDQPGTDATSRLSPYLKWGTLHPRQLLDRLGPGDGPATFRSELAWREFYADVLHHRPSSAREALDAAMATIDVDEGPDADEHFAAWCDGRTGYPIVDAGMRQLVTEGWMHNRVRMIVASFLVKDLHLDWTRGARFFMHHLVDGDLASNSHGWQWVAGTGTDAAPYFRVFNPIGQSRRFDPGGDYLRRWVPELADLDDGDIHEPWVLGGSAAGYPPPIVDHPEERSEALARYQRVKGNG